MTGKRVENILTHRFHRFNDTARVRKYRTNYRSFKTCIRRFQKIYNVPHVSKLCKTRVFIEIINKSLAEEYIL